MRVCSFFILMSFVAGIWAIACCRPRAMAENRKSIGCRAATAVWSDAAQRSIIGRFKITLDFDLQKMLYMDMQ